MSQEKTIQFFTERIIKNEDLVAPYKEYEFHLFREIRSLIFESINCIMLGLCQSSICVTNHLLERALKYSLIQNDIGNDNISIPNFFEKLSTAYNSYDGLTLNETIKKSFDKGLINDMDKEMIISWKNQYRNPFSHANVSNILPNKGENMYYRGFSNMPIPDTHSRLISTGSSINIHETFIPAILTAQYYQQTFAEKTYIQYFDSVFELMKRLDNRHIEKYGIIFPPIDED